MADDKIVQSPFGFFSIVPLPSEEELSLHYQNVYFQENTALNYQSEYLPSEIDYFTNEHERLLLALSKVMDLKKQTVLEIGVGEGFLLNLMLNRGLDAIGIDYSSFGIRAHNPEVERYVTFGHVAELLASFAQQEKLFDIVIAKHIFEHVINPVELTKLCHQVLRPNGALVVQVPNDFSVVQNLALEQNFISSQFWLAPPEHLHYFSRQSLINLLESFRFSVEDAFADFPIDWFLLNEHSNYVEHRSRGKGAHLARVHIDNLISRNGHDKALDFYRSMACLDLGRDICVIASRV